MRSSGDLFLVNGSFAGAGTNDGDAMILKTPFLFGGISECDAFVVCLGLRFGDQTLEFTMA